MWLELVNFLGACIHLKFQEPAFERTVVELDLSRRTKADVLGCVAVGGQDPGTVTGIFFLESIPQGLVQAEQVLRAEARTIRRVADGYALADDKSLPGIRGNALAEPPHPE